MTISQIKNLYKNNMESWTTMTSIKSEEEISTLWNGNFVDAGDGKVSRFYEKFMQEFGSSHTVRSASLGTAPSITSGLTRTAPKADPTSEELIKAGLQHLIDKGAPSLVAFEPNGPICWIGIYSELEGERFPLPPTLWQIAAVGGTSSIKNELCYSQLTYSYKGALVILQWDIATNKYKFGEL